MDTEIPRYVINKSGDLISNLSLSGDYYFSKNNVDNKN